MPFSFRKIPAFLVIAALLFLYSARPASAAGEDDYLATLTKHIVTHQVYPDSAKLYGLEGDAIISIQVDRKGNILYYRFLRDASHPILHDAVIALLKDATPVPPPPARFFGKSQVAEFMFPLAFRIGVNPESLVPIDEEFRAMLLELSQGSPG